MASGEISVNVSVEAHMHKTFLELANLYREQHGICIKSVDFNWIGLRLGETVPAYLMSVEIKTEGGAA